MTAHELARKLLSGPDLPVHISHPSGDWWRTILAPPIENVSDTFDVIVYSNYHKADILVTDMEKAEEDYGADMRSVIVLS